jgi:hypothetical protein
MFVIDDGLHTSETPVIVTGTAVTVMLALPDLVASSVEVAVQVVVPAPDGVTTPEDVIVPPFAVQVTFVVLVVPSL